MPTARIVRPESEDAVLDMYVELGLLDHDPYWAALWPSSVALARGVAERARGEGGDLRGKNVCDMGAGLGLAGIAAALCGARSVTFYDREPLALQCCLLSAEANGLRVAFEDGRVGGGDPRGETRGEEDDDALSNDALSTATEKETEKTKNRRDNDVDVAYVTASTFDWNAIPSDQRAFDLVLACDVLYESHAVAPVASLVGTLTEKKKWRLARRRPAAPSAQEPRALSRARRRGRLRDDERDETNEGDARGVHGCRAPARVAREGVTSHYCVERELLSGRVVNR